MTDHHPYLPPEISAEHFAAIGRVAEQWSRFERWIDVGCWSAAQVDAETGVCLTSQIAGHGRKLDAFIALVRLKGASGASIAKLNKIAADAAGLAEQRNRLVHDPWVDVGGFGIPHRIEASARRTAVYRHVAVLTEDVQAVEKRIETLLGRFIVAGNGALDECEKAQEKLGARGSL